jgi:soluble lytic murein transglycosylase-like protein
MEQAYWLERQRASVANAHAATDSESRLIHYDLAGYYSVKAACAGESAPEGLNRAVPAPRARPLHRGLKAPRDTAAGCRSRAEADLLASASVLLANQRLRLENSAAHWIARADHLHDVEESFVVPKAAGSRQSS